MFSVKSNKNTKEALDLADKVCSSLSPHLAYLILRDYTQGKPISQIRKSLEDTLMEFDTFDGPEIIMTKNVDYFEAVH